MSGVGERPEPNELAELYDSFEQLRDILERLLQSEATTVSVQTDHPLVDWFAVVHERVRGEGWAAAPSYGQQQYNRNAVSIATYRDAYGDGDRVTEFDAIDAQPLTREEREHLRTHELLRPNESVLIPVAPQSGRRLPLIVQTAEDLAVARDLIDEFPAATESEAPSASTAIETSLHPVSAFDDEQRLNEFVARVDAIETQTKSNRDRDLTLTDINGETVPLTIWETHNVPVEWSDGVWYWFYQPRLQVWHATSGSKYELSSTRDLIAKPLGDEPNEDRIRALRATYDVDINSRRPSGRSGVAGRRGGSATGTHTAKGSDGDGTDEHASNGATSKSTAGDVSEESTGATGQNTDNATDRAAAEEDEDSSDIVDQLMSDIDFESRS